MIVADPALHERLAGLVYAPPNVRDAAQNMMLAAWNDGVASCPNGLPDPASVGELLGLGDGERVVIVLSFGFPHGARDPAARTPALAVTSFPSI